MLLHFNELVEARQNIGKEHFVSSDRAAHIFFGKTFVPGIQFDAEAAQNTGYRPLCVADQFLDVAVFVGADFVPHVVRLLPERLKPAGHRRNKIVQIRLNLLGNSQKIGIPA